MAFTLRFQDPSSRSTRYLDEEILELLLDPDVRAVEGIFAFASVTGAASLVGDPAFHDFIARGGRCRLLVGIDAVTDRATLELLARAVTRHSPNLEALVFKNKYATLFHPKLFRARRTDGSGRLLVGSGNLTAGGLRSNFEAFSVLDSPPGTVPPDSEWDQFLADHGAEITAIDREALEQGDANQRRVAAARTATRGIGRGRRTALHGRAPALRPEEAAETSGAAQEEILEEVGPPPTSDDRILVAQVPRASGRWHQVGFNGDVVRDYFRAAPHTADRISLLRHDPGGYVAEQPRPVILSGVNRNHRIEFGAHHGDAYPASGPPILVLREVGLRMHTYLMLFPGDVGHAEMAAFLASRRSVGRGVPRVIADRGDVQGAWPGLPL